MYGYSHVMKRKDYQKIPKNCYNSRNNNNNNNNNNIEKNCGHVGVYGLTMYGYSHVMKRKDYQKIPKKLQQP